MEEKEPELKDCREADDVCTSMYAKTNVNYYFGPHNITALAGSWAKGCGKSGDPDLALLNYFGEDWQDIRDRPDRCVEIKGQPLNQSNHQSRWQVCNINA